MCYVPRSLNIKLNFNFCWQSLLNISCSSRFQPMTAINNIEVFNFSIIGRRWQALQPRVLILKLYLLSVRDRTHVVFAARAKMQNTSFFFISTCVCYNTVDSYYTYIRSPTSVSWIIRYLERNWNLLETVNSARPHGIKPIVFSLYLTFFRFFFHTDTNIYCYVMYLYIYKIRYR